MCPGSEAMLLKFHRAWTSVRPSVEGCLPVTLTPRDQSFIHSHYTHPRKSLSLSHLVLFSFRWPVRERHLFDIALVDTSRLSQIRNPDPYPLRPLWALPRYKI